MSCFDSVCVVIPSFDPTEKLNEVVAGLVETGFDDIIVVNDGSAESRRPAFESIKKLPQCTVLEHPVNMGKGVALKTAFSHFVQTRSGKAGVVTADSDGQHLPEDVAKCALAIIGSSDHVVMGVRDFSHPSAPVRNSLGNRITALSLRLLFGIKLRDTQTGLRGIPTRHVPMMLDIDGNRFEYETNMLLELKRRSVPFFEVEIATVYEAGSNKRSHYRPVADSARIFMCIFRYWRR